MRDVAIDTFLGGLGLTGAAAATAREALDAEGVTNPRKQRMSEAKRERALAVLDAGFERLCASCAASGAERPTLLVERRACTRCGGSNVQRALAELAAACERAGVRRLVVVGGSPDVRRELRALDGRLELRLVDGTERRTRTEAERDVAWADLVVVAGSSELAHKVSTLYTAPREGREKVVVAHRRGVEAIAAEVLRRVGAG